MAFERLLVSHDPSVSSTFDRLLLPGSDVNLCAFRQSIMILHEWLKKKIRVKKPLVAV
jgi:hypothetical protein